MRIKLILICFIKIIFLKNGCSYLIVMYFFIIIIIFVIVSKLLIRKSIMNELVDDICIFFWCICFIIVFVLYMVYSFSRIDLEIV